MPIERVPTSDLAYHLIETGQDAAAEALAKQIIRMLRPGGSVMGFFCTSSLPQSPFTKYEIVDKTSLRHKLHPGAGGPKHAFLNRDIIKGKVAVQRAYADWRRYPQYIVPLSESSIDLIFAPAFGVSPTRARRSMSSSCRIRASILPCSSFAAW